jgi:hypothetical protein
MALLQRRNARESYERKFENIVYDKKREINSAI